MSGFLLENWFILIKVVMQRKLFQWCTHVLYCSVLSLGGNVDTRRMSKPDMGSIFHIKKSMKYYSGHVNYQTYQNLMLLTSSDTDRTLMHLFLFTNSTQRELVSICTQSVRNCNQLSLHYNLDSDNLCLFVCMSVNTCEPFDRFATHFDWRN